MAGTFEFLKMLPGIVAEGIDMVVEPPVPFRKLDLRVERLKEWGDDTLLIQCTVRYEQYDSRVNCQVGIDVKKKMIDWDTTSSWMFNRQHKGSGALGVLLLSLPVTIPLYPYLHLVAKRRCLKEEECGMSRHGTALMEVLRGDEPKQAQLPDETLALLETALRNEYAWEKKYRRHVGFAEAQEVLKEADLTVVVIETEVSRNGEKQLSYDWRDDDGERIAHAWVIGGFLKRMTVLDTDSSFSDWNEEQWMHLLTCYRSKKEMTREEARARYEARKGSE